MRNIVIYAVGRLRDQAISSLCEDYFRRCQKRVKLAAREFANERSMLAALPARGFNVALDVAGERCSSEAFATLLDGWLNRPSASQLSFIIGSADGLGVQARKLADYQLSLSSMTFGHRIARLVLAEQLYRAVSILDGTPYHRQS